MNGQMEFPIEFAVILGLLVFLAFFFWARTTVTQSQIKSETTKPNTATTTKSNETIAHIRHETAKMKVDCLNRKYELDFELGKSKLSTELAAQQSRLAEQSLKEDGKLSRRVLEVQARTSLAEKELAWRGQEVESNERMFQQN